MKYLPNRCLFRAILQSWRFLLKTPTNLFCTEFFINLCHFLIVTMWVFFWFQCFRNTLLFKITSLHLLRGFGEIWYSDVRMQKASYACHISLTSSCWIISTRERIIANGYDVISLFVLVAMEPYLKRCWLFKQTWNCVESNSK